MNATVHVHLTFTVDVECLEWKLELERMARAITRTIQLQYPSTKSSLVQDKDGGRYVARTRDQGGAQLKRGLYCGACNGTRGGALFPVLFVVVVVVVVGHNGGQEAVVVTVQDVGDCAGAGAATGEGGHEGGGCIQIT